MCLHALLLPARRYCGISALPPSLSCLSGLTALALDGAIWGRGPGMPLLPVGASVLSRLQQLSLYESFHTDYSSASSSTRSLPPAAQAQTLATVATLTALTFLDLSCNSLGHLPPAMSSLQHLEVCPASQVYKNDALHVRCHAGAHPHAPS